MCKGDIRVFEKRFSEVWMKRNYRLWNGDAVMRLFFRRERRLASPRFRQ